MSARWPGYFISFEGLDGAGKSTQVAALGAALRKHGHDPVSVAPSDTELGDMATGFLLTHQVDAPLDPWAEALLFIASRIQLLRQTILPALAAGRVVVVDRWADSTLAYQGGARGLGIEQLRALHRIALDDVWPDLTLFLDLPLETAMQRQRAQQLPLDRIAQAPEQFHAAVDRTFRELIVAEPERFLLIDSTQSAVEVSRQVWDAVQTRLDAAGQPATADAAGTSGT